VQFLRFAGATPGSPVVDHKEVYGRLVELIQRVEEILENHIRTALRFADVPRAIETSDYPIAALRQVFRNAVMHRAYDGTNAPIRIHWFDDRIEVHNPGGPFGQVTPANFGAGVTDYRNPNLAAALRDLRFVEKFGQGLHLAQAALARNGSPPLSWELDVTATTVKIARHP
jgi:ATP-dependent DNA helicase RecG